VLSRVRGVVGFVARGWRSPLERATSRVWTPAARDGVGVASAWPDNRNRLRVVGELLAPPGASRRVPLGQSAGGSPEALRLRRGPRWVVDARVAVPALVLDRHALKRDDVRLGVQLRQRRVLARLAVIEVVTDGEDPLLVVELDLHRLAEGPKLDLGAEFLAGWGVPPHGRPRLA